MIRLWRCSRQDSAAAIPWTTPHVFMLKEIMDILTNIKLKRLCSSQRNDLNMSWVDRPTAECKKRKNNARRDIPIPNTVLLIRCKAAQDNRSLRRCMKVSPTGAATFFCSTSSVFLNIIYCNPIFAFCIPLAFPHPRRPDIVDGFFAIFPCIAASNWTEKFRNGILKRKQSWWISIGHIVQIDWYQKDSWTW